MNAYGSIKNGKVFELVGVNVVLSSKGLCTMEFIYNEITAVST
jgi:hypothetical protein